MPFVVFEKSTGRVTSFVSNTDRETARLTIREGEDLFPCASIDLVPWPAAVIDGALVPDPSQAATPFQLRITANTSIDDDAGSARAAFITITGGQEAVYLTKLEEARALMANPDTFPDPTLYPYLAAEVGVTADTITNVAQVVLNLAAAWAQAGAAIEKARLEGKAAVAAATTAETILAATQAAQIRLQEIGTPPAP